MKALILAAGLGTRLRPYTNQTPKPLFSVGGRPLLDLIIENLQKAGCEAVIINTHHLHLEIETHVANRRYGIPVSTRHEPQILGTGGAIKNVADFWDHRPFMVINADIVADIDLADVYQTHCRENPSATLVLCDDPDFNSVAVRQNKWITGFAKRKKSTDRYAQHLLTFTGIQVLDPLVLEYIPDKSVYSSIDAFKAMLADGKPLQAYLAPDERWQDIGTPERYRRTAFESVWPLAFHEAFGGTHDFRIEKKKLKGDGSERQWYRLQADVYSMVMVDHGIRIDRSNGEVDAFVHIGRHLYRQGVSVPRIYFHDTFCGLVFLEDLGDVDLQQTARLATGPKALVALYKAVIDQLVRLSVQGAENFDPAWAYQSARYDRELIIEKECRYFHEAFLNDYLGLNLRFDDLADDYEALAQRALQDSIPAFMHRDMQSRNIMIKNHQVFFIDFQGGRLGPVQYDLASLLIDPYVELPPSVQAQLLDYSMEVLSQTIVVDPETFRRCFYYCCLTRNLQILGAFAFLSKVKGKHYFADYIPAALRCLRSRLLARGRDEFPALTAAVSKVEGQLQKTAMTAQVTKDRTKGGIQ